MKVRIELDEKFLTTCGDGSLLGMLVKGHSNIQLGNIGTVVLVIPETTTKYREENGGPKLFILNEYTLGCVLSDVLTLQRLGMKVEIERPLILDK